MEVQVGLVLEALDILIEGVRQRLSTPVADTSALVIFREMVHNSFGFVHRVLNRTADVHEDPGWLR